MSDDPYHWKALVVRSLRGDSRAFGELLIDFADVLQMFFERILPIRAAARAVDDTLRSVSEKLGTCDARQSILSWLLAIATYRMTHSPQRSLTH
jgi:DNA-directed RNA polymerase specialized sigma24 family protein